MQILNDFNTSVRRALEEIDPNYESYEGLVICGTHSPHNVEEMVNEIKLAREKDIPFLGICFGLQLAAIEVCSNTLHWRKQTSQEFEPNEMNALVAKLPSLRVGMLDGGESYWHNYGVRWYFMAQAEGINKDIKCEYITIPGFDKIVNKMELKSNKHHIGVQFHPEYQSSKNKPHPLLVKFIELCKK